MHNRGVNSPSEAFVLVYSTSSLVDGYITKGRLEAEGIPVLMKGEGEGPYRMGPAHLLVPQRLEVQAKLVLETPLEELSDAELAAEAEAAEPEDSDGAQV